MKCFCHSCRWAARAAIPFVLAVAVGCKSTDWGGLGHCNDIPKGAIPRPLGTAACQWQHAHMERAESDDFVFYQYEWLDGGIELGPFGRKHLARLLPRLTHSPEIVLIEGSGDVELNESRRLRMIGLLIEHHVPAAEARVVVGYPEAEGMYGFEAPFILQGYQGAGATGTAGGGGESSSAVFGF